MMIYRSTYVNVCPNIRLFRAAFSGATRDVVGDEARTGAGCLRSSGGKPFNAGSPGGPLGAPSIRSRVPRELIAADDGSNRDLGPALAIMP